MKRVSWEIIISGLIFVAAAIYLMGKPSDNNTPSAASAEKQEASKAHSEEVHVIDLQDLNELSKVQDISNIEELKKLKELAHLIPTETRDEFLTEINNAVRDLSNDKVNIEIDLKDKLIVVDRNYDNLTSGKWANTSPGVYTYLSEFDGSSLQNTILDLPQGSIKIIGSSTNKAKLTLQASGQIDSIEDLKSQIGFTAEIDNQNATFLAKNLIQDQNIQLQATLNIPESIRITGKTGAGHIEVTNIEGVQVYETGGGHIKLERVRGEVSGKSQGGHVTLRDGAGEFTLETTGGHVSALNIDGKTTLSSMGGNVEARNITGEVNATTKGGNITLNLSDTDHPVFCETLAGNIVIGIPTNGSATLNLKASNSVDILDFTVDGKVNKTTVSGDINGGGPEITASTKFGKIIFKKND